MKNKICDIAEEYKSILWEIADYLHANPELGNEEFKSADFLKKQLIKESFKVGEALPKEFPTSFHAMSGNGKINIGFLAEYDALPEIGHACGHNLIAGMSVLAGIVCSKVLGDKATVHVFGCPAEETVGSKTVMSEKGMFKNLDAVLICHPDNVTAFGGTSYATHPLRITFLGKPAHVADPDYHGINALDTLVDFYQRLNELQTSFKKPYILGKIITEGGNAPNIIPDRCTMKATIRSLDADYLEGKMLFAIKELAKKVAKEHDTELELEHYEPLYKNMINNKCLEKFMQDNLKALGVEDIRIYPDDYADGSTDVGNVSHDAATIQPTIKIGTGIDAHTPEFAVAAGSEYAKEMALLAVKAMSMTACDVISSKEREMKMESFYIEEISDELMERMKGKSFKDDCSVPREDLRYLHVLHKNLANETMEGEMVCNRHIAEVVLKIFKELYEADYAIEKIRLVDEYNADDDLSMTDNNSSSFNFRLVS